MTEEYKCSFCGAPRSEVHKLVKSPFGVFICDECVFTAAHMMVYVKPEKARKVTDEPLYDELSKAIDEACKMLSEITGTCPRDFYGLDEGDCDARCSADIDMGGCWRDYFLGRL